MNAQNGIFEEVVEYPDTHAMRQFASLVGLDDVKEHLIKEAMLLVDHTLIEKWSKSHYSECLPIIDTFRDRSSLFIFAGDVGTGKTALAESMGDPLARKLDLPVMLYRLSLTARGTGAVGEMTALISAAFTEVRDAARKAQSSNGRPRGVYILLIDEADALAQSRELAQMHHEDRAGVNAIIRGIDDLATNRMPVAVIMCTNRLGSIDPAIRRRAAKTFSFNRPNESQRRSVLEAALSGTSLNREQIDVLVAATGQRSAQPYGHTYSDLTQRFLPQLVLDAFPDRPITFERAKEIAEQMSPTPPFKETLSNE